MIDIRNLLVQRNGRDVLKIKSLSIEHGETLAVVGPNGAGKSSLLLTLANLIEPVEGEIHFKGINKKNWNDLEYRRQIAFVFQDPLLLDMSVEENITLGLGFRGIRREEAYALVLKWSKALGVESLLKRRAGQLSGGEAQRVSLARAFVLNPSLLLMDEPFSAVDPQKRAILLNDLSAALSKEKRTSIFVTHNLKEAAQFGDRIAVIMKGELRQVSTAAHLRKKPADADVKKFIHGL